LSHAHVYTRRCMYACCGCTCASPARTCTPRCHRAPHPPLCTRICIHRCTPAPAVLRCTRLCLSHTGTCACSCTPATREAPAPSVLACTVLRIPHLITRSVVPVRTPPHQFHIHSVRPRPSHGHTTASLSHIATRWPRPQICTPAAALCGTPACAALRAFPPLACQSPACSTRFLYHTVHRRVSCAALHTHLLSF
jgi:hypothetical protein